MQIILERTKSRTFNKRTIIAVLAEVEVKVLIEIQENTNPQETIEIVIVLHEAAELEVEVTVVMAVMKEIANKKHKIPIYT